MSVTIHVGDEHVQVWDLWRQRGDRDLSICHIDFHCDMRGLLIDRRRARAYRIDGGDRRIAEPDSGNFMAHAVLEGVVTSLTWVHAAHAGRRYDTGTCKYETDLTAQPHRLLHRLRGGDEVPFDYREVTFDRWGGPPAGQPLDIDWDGIGSIEYDVPQIRRLMDQVLERDWSRPPSEVYLIVSPGYSHPDRSLLDEFLERLRDRLGAEVLDLPPYQGPPHRAETIGLVESLEKRVVLGLRRVGIY